MPQPEQGLSLLSRLLKGHALRPSDPGRGPSRVGWRPGHLGPIPFLLVLRVLVAAGIVLRFWMHGWTQGHPVMFGVLGGVFIATSLIAIFLRAGDGQPAQVAAIWLVVVLLDVGVISGFYWLTQNPQSDFFLFYYLPLFTAAEYLRGRDVGGRYVVATFAISTLAFLAVILLIQPEAQQPQQTPEQLLVPVFLPREVFFLAVSAILAFRLHREVATVSERARLFNALQEVGAAAPGVVVLHEHLESMLDYLVDELGFEYATISLVDEYERKIRAIRGRNVPPGWIARAVHALDSNDIQSYVVENAETVVSDSWDKRFDREIWNRYNHGALARVFAPLVSGGKVIGTLEAGSQREKRMDVRARSAAVTRLGRDRGADIERVLPHALLELVANHAAQLIGADSASLHVFEGKTSLLVAAAGKAKDDPNFLRNHPPSAAGIGEAAMAQGFYEVLERIPQSKPVYAAGVRSMAAFPLHLAPDIRGVLYVHYWHKIHKFTREELELVSVFVPQMEVAIHNHLVFRQISRGAEEAATVTGLQRVIRALSERPATDEEAAVERLLGELTDNILHMLDARNVTLYEYFAQNRQFAPRAVIRGDFNDISVMKTQVHPGDVVHQAIREGSSLFIADFEKEPAGQFLRGPRQDGIARKRFVERERIRSCVVLLLRSPYDDEIVGCLFANYRAPHFEGKDGKSFRALATSLAAAVAVAIQTRRLYVREISARKHDAETTKRELDALRAVDRAIVSGARKPNLELIYNELLTQARNTLGADAGDVTLWEPERGRLRIVTAQGYPKGNSEESLSERVRLGRGIVGWVARSKQPFRTGNVRSLPRQEPGGPAPDGPVPAYSEVDPETCSELAVPMLEGEGDALVGVINLEQRNADAFTDRHEQFLRTLAVQGAIAIHSVRQYGRLERQFQQALVLSRVGERLLRPGRHGKTRNVDEVLRLIVTGLTAGVGLGFSRAFVFTADAQTLTGYLAVGARTDTEAHQTWKALEEKADEISTSGHDFLHWQLNDAERLAHRVSLRPETDSGLSQDSRKLSLPLDLPGLVATCFETRSSQILQGSESDPLRGYLAPLYEGADRCALACTPLILGDERFGLVVLDRRFKFDEEFIDRDTRPMLDAFARWATLSLHSVRLKDQLATYQQLANWRRAVDDVTHTLNTRLRRVGDNIGRVETQLALRQVIEARQALTTRVKRSVLAAGRLVDTIARLGTPLRMATGAADIADVLKTVAAENAGCVIDLESSQLWVLGDADAMYDIFSELVDNARWELQEAATKNPEIRISCRSLEGDVYVAVSDNGPGVAPELVEKLFERGTSGSDSSGLGLAIARRLAEEQGGAIRYCGADPTGACFTVTLRRAAILEEAGNA